MLLDDPSATRSTTFRTGSRAGCRPSIGKQSSAPGASGRIRPVLTKPNGGLLYNAGRHELLPRTSWRVALFVVATLLAAGLTPVHASTFLKLDVPGLTGRSESVVHARVVSSESAWNTRRSMIFTNVTLDVIRTIHGRSRDRIVVRVPGGTVGDRTFVVEGAPEFPAAGTVVGFIGEWPDGAAKVIGYFQGVSQLTPDGRGNQVLRGGSGSGLTLESFIDQVQQAGGGR